MLQPVGVGHKSLADYTHLVGKPLIEEVKELAEGLNGLKVLHLSATAFGGGVSELLFSFVLLLCVVVFVFVFLLFLNEQIALQ